MAASEISGVSVRSLTAPQVEVQVGLVSTIIPVYNRALRLMEAVGSVLSQDYRPIEIIIVDDGSTDTETAQAARRLFAEHPGVVRVFTQDNAGPGAAREQGRRMARGEFIQYLDSDDLLLPGKFSAQVRGLRSDIEAGISYGLTLSLDERSGASRPTHGTEAPHRTIFPRILQSRFWPTLSPLYRSSVCDAIGAWSPQRILEDWDYDCRAGLVKGMKLHYCADPVAVVRYHGGTHAGLAWQGNVDAMRDRAQMYARVVQYGHDAGVDIRSSEMQQLVRSVFWMARETGAHGLPREAEALFRLAKRHATQTGLDFFVLGKVARLVGWQRAGLFAKRFERWRSIWRR